MKVKNTVSIRIMKEEYTKERAMNAVQMKEMEKATAVLKKMND